MGKVRNVLFPGRKKRKVMSFTVAANLEPPPTRYCVNCGAVIMVPKSAITVTVAVEIKIVKPDLCQVCKKETI